MAKKRKAERLGLDEVERTVFSSFCTAANAISQLYTQSQQQQKVAFQAGERHGLEKLYMWLQKEQQQGSNISVAQILDHLRNQVEGGCGRDEVSMPPGPPAQHWFAAAPAGAGAGAGAGVGVGAGGLSGMARAGGPAMQRRGGLESHEYGRQQGLPTSFHTYSIASQADVGTGAGAGGFGHISSQNQERQDDASMDM